MNRKVWLTLGAALLLGVANIAPAVAQNAGEALVNWWVMAGGGEPASAGTVVINDTLGQPVVGASTSADGQVGLEAGYWVGMSEVWGGDQHIYLPLVTR